MSLSNLIYCILNKFNNYVNNAQKLMKFSEYISYNVFIIK